MNNVTAREIIIDNFTAINNNLKKLVPLEDITKEYSIGVDTFTYRIRECYPLEYKAYLSHNILNKRKKGIYEVYNVKKNIEDVYTFLYFQNLLLIDYRNKKSVSLEDFCKYVLTIKDEFDDSDIEGKIMQLLEREEALDGGAVSKDNQHKYKKEKLKTEKSIEKVAEKEPAILDSTVDLHSTQDNELSLDEEIALYREALAKEEESASEDLEVDDVDLNPLFRRPIPLDMTTRYETESNTESMSYENLNRLGGFFNYDLIGILNRAWIKLYRYYDGELYDLNVTFDVTLEHFEVEGRRGLNNVGVLAKLFHCK